MRNTVSILALAALLTLAAAPGAAEAQGNRQGQIQGYDYSTRQHIDLPENVLPGQNIEVFVHGEGYKRMQIFDVYNHGRGRNVVAIDPMTGKRRVIELQR